MHIKLNYPVILIHGTGAKDNNLFWGRIPRILRENGVDVFYGKTDAWGSIENNAEMLLQNLNEIAKKTNVQKFNLIGHSKGGIDARYLISSLKAKDMIASLTSISTPHLGTPLADYIIENQLLSSPLAKKLLLGYARLFCDAKPMPVSLLRSLCIKEMAEFNQMNIDQNGVFYQSYATQLQHYSDDIFYLPTYRYLKNTVGENDGIVPLAHAVWGERFTAISGKKRGISHAEITDTKRRLIGGTNIPALYIEIAKSLQERGL